MAQLIDGKKISLEVREEIAMQVDELRQKGITPGLTAILVGGDPASMVYVRSKEKACEKAGIASNVIRLTADLSQYELETIVDEQNAREDVHGILVQLPLPDHLDEQRIINRILPEKDVDGFHPQSIGNLLLEQPGFIPATPCGIMELFKRSGIATRGKQVVIVGRSHIVGKPMAALLMQKGEQGDATVTVCHSRTANLAEVTRGADILIAAIGRPEMIRGDMVKPGAVVIDVGINRVEDATRKKGYRLVGDVAFSEVEPLASAITPVPGGVGPMTIAMLLKNTLQAARMLEAK
jgi:methylenetetrahydrofolate dehydrogenase (NADP+) / methenyltetrahydrofolate cyclohydrolase